MAKDTSKKPAAEPAAYTVHESVIISLARKAVEGIPGFIRFSGSSIVSFVEPFSILFKSCI